MSNKFHKDVTGRDVHVVYSFSFANETDMNGAQRVPEDIGKVAKLDDGSFWILSNNDPLTWIPLTSVDTDKLVAIASGETPGYLGDLLEAGANVTITVDQGKLVISSEDTDTDTDELVSLKAGDTPAYLNQLIEAGSNVTITEVGGKLRIQSTDTTIPNTDQFVATQPGATPDYLANLLLPGNNVTLTVVGGKIRVDSTDTTIPNTDELVAVDSGEQPDYLNEILQAGSNVSIVQSNGRLIISSTDTTIPNTDETVAVDATQPAGYLEDVVQAGSNVTINKSGDMLVISATDTTIPNTDEQVATSAGEAPGYLEDVLEAGSNVTLTESNGKITIDAAGGTGGSPGGDVQWYYASSSDQGGAFGHLPSNSSFPVDRDAQYRTDPDTGAFYTYAFDDDHDEGVQFLSHVPSGATQVKFCLWHHARSSSSGDTVCFKIHARGKAPGDDLDGGWVTSSPKAINVGNNTDDLFYHEETFTLTDLGLNVNEFVQYELSRNAGHSADDSHGDWILISIGVEYL